MTRKDPGSLTSPWPAEQDRREFLQASVSLAALAGLGPLGCSEESGEIPDPFTSLRVVEVHDAKSISGKTIDATRAAGMLRAGLCKLASQTDIKQAWRTLIPDFSSSMRIGIKVNCLSSYVYNSPELVFALVKTLVQDLGADSSRILVWDRREDELIRSKLTDQSTGAKVVGTVKSTSDKSGPGYETTAVSVGSGSTHLSRILTEQTDITINMPLLKTHTVSGVTGALKNVYGCIDNPGDFHTGINEDLPVIYALDKVRTSCRLHITEAFLAVIKGDTSDPPDSFPARILLAADPVAMDARIIELTNTLRGTLPNVVAAKLKWLDGAAGKGLGSRSMDLQLVEIT